jgi:hypothetical protein
MSILVAQGDGNAPAEADMLAAEALAQVLARHNLTDTAVAVNPAGDYVVMAYAEWKAGAALHGCYEDWKLKGVAWKAA